MAIRKIHRRNRELSLDLTPLIDCVFLLLIFFMVGTQLINEKSGLKIDLPKSSVVEVSEIKDIMLFVDKNKNMEVAFTNSENKRVTEEIGINELEAYLTEKLQYNEAKNVIIKADKELTHGDIVELMTIAKKAGAASLDIATENEK